FFSPDGKPRHSIISIAHLDDAQRMFFVTILLNEVLAWMRTQPGTGSLRSLLYMDEVFGYFPPSKNPPSKEPMLTLLKQARAFGLGCVLATQNPVDLDYKGLSNAGTWFLGRLQTERDKMRVMEGLEGASAQAGNTFDKQAMERTLAGVGSRVFLMNNVHEDAPRVFHTRWAMSYLAGPLSRDQIKELMDPVRDAVVSPEGDDEALAAAPANRPAKAASPPSTGVEARFVETNERVPKDVTLEYRPGLLGVGKVHFVKTTGGFNVDRWRDTHVLKCFNEDVPDGLWEGALVHGQPPVTRAEAEYDDAEYDELPRELANEKSYKGFARELKDWLYQTQRVTLFKCDALDATSQTDETEAEFRTRIAGKAGKLLESERRALEAPYDKKIAKAEAAVAKRLAYYEEQKSQFWGRLLGVGLKVLELVMAAVGGKATSRRTSSSVSAARQASTERSQSARAQAAYEEAVAELEALQTERDEKLQELEASFTPEHLDLETVEIGPRKSDIDVDVVTLVWLPHRIEANGRALPIY
ncbi:MAG: ATP-binding protein, partial [Planctomycetota bacterium]